MQKLERKCQDLPRSIQLLYLGQGCTLMHGQNCCEAMEQGNLLLKSYQKITTTSGSFNGGRSLPPKQPPCSWYTISHVLKGDGELGTILTTLLHHPQPQNTYPPPYLTHFHRFTLNSSGRLSLVHSHISCLSLPVLNGERIEVDWKSETN